MTQNDKDKLASFYTTDAFQSLKALIDYKIKVSKNDVRTQDTSFKTIVSVAKCQGGEDFGISLLEDIKRIYKELIKKTNE